MFGKEPYGDIDPATVVAQGAAILGATFELPGEKPPEDKIEDIPQVTNRTSHFLGIEMQGQRFSKILEKNLEFPVEKAKAYATTQDNQPELRIGIFQFPEDTEFIDLKIPGSACLGEFHLGPLDPAPRGTVPVNVTFTIDANGMLKVAAQSQGKAGLSKELEVRIT